MRSGGVFDVEGGVVESVDDLALGCGEIGSVLRGGGEQAGGGEADGELVAGAGVIRAGEKGRVGRNAGVGGKVEIAFAVLGGFGKFFDQAGGGVDGGPVDAGVVGDGQAAENVFRVLQDGGEEIGLGVAVVAGEISGADGEADVVLVGEAVEILEEADGFVGGKTLGVFGEGLRDDAEVSTV